MVKRIPLKFDFDLVKTPSAIAEFNASDVVYPVNGGTGVSSLADLGIILATTNVSALSVSATTISSPTFTGGTFTGPTVSGTDVQGVTISSPGDASSLYFKRDPDDTYPNLIKARSGALTLMAENNIALRTQTGELHAKFTPNGANEFYYDNSKKLETQDDGVVVTGAVSATSVSATDISGITFNGMSYPPPYGFVQLTTNGDSASTETRIGAGATVLTAISNTDDINWNLTEDYFMVSAVGVYEITANLISTVAASTKFTLKIKKNGVDVNTAESMIHSSIDPTQTSLQSVFLCAAGDYIEATHTDDGSQDVTANTGSSILIKRVA